ncbi:uncharacterized protein IWZ02DRAFT_239539 [Phyllosticta citriasiana]|uniref:uncharacterized protein n=1 Tax=Phyllosticta citriasiana TaxID=595635 RepID=UPI0030FDC451
MATPLLLRAMRPAPLQLTSPTCMLIRCAATTTTAVPPAKKSSARASSSPQATSKSASSKTAARKPTTTSRAKASSGSGAIKPSSTSTIEDAAAAQRRSVKALEHARQWQQQQQQQQQQRDQEEAAAAAAARKEEQQQQQQRKGEMKAEYKPVARRVLAAIVAAPIAIVSSWMLWERSEYLLDLFELRGTSQWFAEFWADFFLAPWQSCWARNRERVRRCLRERLKMRELVLRVCVRFG